MNANWSKLSEESAGNRAGGKEPETDFEKDTSPASASPAVKDLGSTAVFSNPGNKTRVSKRTRISEEPIVDVEREASSEDLEDNASNGSDSSDNLSYDADAVMGYVVAVDNVKYRPPPPEPVPFETPSWAQAPQINPISLRSLDSWHRSRGHVTDRGPHTATLNRILNQVVPTNEEPPHAAQYPLLAGGPSKEKHRWVNKLYDHVSLQHQSNRAQATVESVCLARELRSPRKHATGGYSPRRQQPPQVSSSGSTARVQLPQLQQRQQYMDSVVDMCPHFQDALAPSSRAPATSTPSRHKFYQSKPGWQPWRTHRTRAFDPPTGAGHA